MVVTTITAMKNTPITDCYRDARNCVNTNKEKARDYADAGIVFLADTVTKLKLKDEDILEGVCVRLWYERFWIFLENSGLLLDQDESPENNYFYELMKQAELV